MGGEELPGLLVNEIGGLQGILHSHVAFLKKHFCLITMGELLENRRLRSKKVQAIYLWWHKPVIDRELLHLVSHKMQKPKYAGLAGHHMAISSGLEHCEANFLGVQVTGAALGIISMGSTGYEIALRAKAFAMNILYHNRTQRKEQEEHAVGTAHCERVDDLLRQEDFVMVVVNLTPQTHKLTGKRELELMKPTATLINISRDHALLKLKNVLIAPHLGIKTDKATDLITEEAVENILSALNGLPMPSEVLPR